MLLTTPCFAKQTLVPPSPKPSYDIGIRALDLLALGKCHICDLGRNKVSVGGSTSAQSSIEYVAVRVYLQKWSGSSWETITSVIFEERDSNYVDGSYTYVVEPGYYYRTKGLHLCRDGSISESEYSYSDSIYID